MAKVKFRFYGGLLQVTNGEKEKEIQISAPTLREALGQCENIYGKAFYERVFNKQGQLQNFIRAFVNDRDVRFLKGLDTELPEGASISLIPAIGGG